MRPAGRKRHEIFRAFYALTAVVVLSVTVVAVSFVIWHSREQDLRERLERFHLRSTLLMFEASRQTSSLQLELASIGRPDSGNPDRLDRLNRDREIQTSLHALKQAMDSIVALQDAWAGPADPFTESLERASDQLRGLREREAVTQATAEDMLDSVAAFRFTLFQLDRLHGIAAQNLLDRIERAQSRNTQRVVLLSGFVLLAGGLIAARIVFLLRARLLEHERMERTLRERETQLQQASKLEALGSLVGGVAHDFNNLLTAILGHTEILLGRTSTSDAGRNTLSEIKRAGERAADLTRQLLVFSRHQVVEPQVIEINSVIRDLEPMLRRLIREHIRLDFDLRPDVGVVEVDPTQLEQVLVNLAINARDAMPGGGVLTVRTDRTHVDGSGSAIETPGDYVRIELQDAGCGMPPEVLSRLFDPFFTTKQRGQGTGLGLSIVHGIVTKAGGFVHVHSETGRGSRFDVFLPVSAKARARDEGEAEQEISSHGTETVLVVEDEPQIRELVACTLSGEGYEVLVAGDGNEALEVCAEHPGKVRLILSDVVMPGMGGPEMVRKAIKLQPRAGVVYISGYAETEMPEDGSLPDGAPVLTKPFELKQLLKVVRRELDAARAREEAAQGLQTPTG